MTFNLTLNSYQLAELKEKLSGLITEMDYNEDLEALTIDNSDPANEPAIVKLVASNTRSADLPSAEELEPINWADLAREAEKAKRRAALEARQDLAKIQAKRRRQEAF